MRAGRRDIGHRRYRDVIAPAAGRTGTGSHVTPRRACRVDVSVVDVAVDEAEKDAGNDQYSQNNQTDIHRELLNLALPVEHARNISTSGSSSRLIHKPEEAPESKSSSSLFPIRPIVYSPYNMTCVMLTYTPGDIDLLQELFPVFKSLHNT